MVTNLPEKFVVDKNSLTEIVSGTEWEGFAKSAVAVRHHDERNQFNVEFYDGAGGFLGVAHYRTEIGKPPATDGIPYSTILTPRRHDLPKIQVILTPNVKIGVLKQNG